MPNAAAGASVPSAVRLMTRMARCCGLCGSLRAPPQLTTSLTGTCMRSLLVVACVCCPLMAVGADRLNLKSGLWEISATTELGGLPPLPKEMVEGLSPEQRAQLEANIARGRAAPQTFSSRECLTEQDLDKPFDTDGLEDCTYDLVRSTRTSQEYKLTCKGENGEGSGTIKIAAPTPETMTSMVEATIGTGDQRMTFKVQTKGRWLGPDCGAEAQNGERGSEEDEG